jgi:hypothetical protein
VIWLRKLKYLLPSYRRTEDTEVESELQSLVEIAADDGAGLGNLTLAREDARAVGGWTWLASIAAVWGPASHGTGFSGGHAN